MSPNSEWSDSAHVGDDGSTNAARDVSAPANDTPFLNYREHHGGVSGVQGKHLVQRHIGVPSDTNVVSQAVLADGGPASGGDGWQVGVSGGRRVQSAGRYTDVRPAMISQMQHALGEFSRGGASLKKGAVVAGDEQGVTALQNAAALMGVTDFLGDFAVDTRSSAELTRDTLPVFSPKKMGGARDQ